MLRSKRREGDGLDMSKIHYIHTCMELSKNILNGCSKHIQRNT